MKRTINGVELEIGSGANLQYAYLQGANLRAANLRAAYLQGADLRAANLRGANLQYANLQGADLHGADLQGATLPDDRTLAEYIAWLPAGLLTQGGKPLDEVVAAWDRHTWKDCPIACAFGVGGLDEVPECWRAAATLFVALFDGGHLPKPVAP